MKGLEKLTTIRLAEILTQKNAVETEILTDALYGHDRYGESFVETLIEGNHISEWELAKLVVEHFQLPFVMAGNYDVEDEAKKLIPKEAIFRHLIVPLDSFGKIVTIAMPILTPAEILTKLKRQTGHHYYPYVGLVSENRRVLTEMFDDFKPFQDRLAQERERAAQKRAAQGAQGATRETGGGDWMSIFDSGDEQVRSSLNK